MSKSVLSAKHFHDEAAAFEWVEARVWPQGPVCPHCGGTDRISKMQGKSTRLGTYKCYQCRKPFTVKVGTIFESSHVAMHLWLQAIFLMSSSKKGVSSNQIHRTLGVTLKTAWFMSHRIREAMRDGVLTPMGGDGGIVEADETYYGRTKEPKVSKQRKGRPYAIGSRGPRDKRPIVSLVERGGRVRSFHIENADKATVARIVMENVARESRLHTDESRLYTGADQAFASHETVKHSRNEYARGDVHTNSVEGFFSIFKRGMQGVYQQCSEKHLHRFLAEYDFRYNNRSALGFDDTARAEQAVRGIVGKRLTYQTTRAS
jgi:transposase-like protein